MDKLDNIRSVLGKMSDKNELIILGDFDLIAETLCKSSEDDYTSTLDLNEKNALLNLINNVLNGVKIDDHDCHTLIGVDFAGLKVIQNKISAQ